MGLPPDGHPLAAYWNADKKAFDYDKAGADWTARDQAFTQAAERAKGVPASPDKYELKLPDDFKAPDGAEIKFDTKDPVTGPILSAAQALMHEVDTGKITGQQAFSRFLDLQAKYQLATAQAWTDGHQKMVADEITKLGGEQAATARRAPIQAYLTANFDKDEIAELNLPLSTAAGTRALEKLIAKANGGPAAHPNDPPARAEPAQPIESKWYGQTPQRKVS